MKDNADNPLLLSSQEFPSQKSVWCISSYQDLRIVILSYCLVCTCSFAILQAGKVIPFSLDLCPTRPLFFFSCQVSSIFLKVVFFSRLRVVYSFLLDFTIFNSQVYMLTHTGSRRTQQRINRIVTSGPLGQQVRALGVCDCIDQQTYKQVWPITEIGDAYRQKYPFSVYLPLFFEIFDSRSFD